MAFAPLQAEPGSALAVWSTGTLDSSLVIHRQVDRFHESNEVL